MNLNLSFFKHLPVFICLLFVQEVKAQDRTCETARHHALLLATDPGYALRFNAQFQQILQLETKLSRQSALDSVILVPVVVHVIWNTKEQNISDEQVKSQIDVMNEDFAALNVTRLDVPVPLRGLVQDSKIRFCLAKRDVNGNLFNGIVRVQTAVESFLLFDNRIYDDSTGGSTAWPRDQYMNIWCTALENNALGYANFPGGNAAQDGIVINTKAFGRIGNVKAPYNLGRTCTHESGHWMNLYHTWGDDGGDCTGTDQINDTPNQGDAHFRCPSFPSLDACTPDSNGTFYMNYLDYTDDHCMMFFTPRQILRMRNTFLVSRLPVLSSPAVSYPVINGTEAEIDSVIAPVFEEADRCFKPLLRLHNAGSLAIVNPSFRYRLSNGLYKSYTAQVSVAAGSSIQLELPEIAGVPGDQVLEVWLELNDLIRTNNFISASFRVNPSATFTCGNAEPLVIPNPVGKSQQACVKTNYPESRLVTVLVTDVAGRRINQFIQMVNPGDAIPLNLQQLRGGVYLVRLTSDQGNSTARFIYQPSDDSGGLTYICN